MTSSTIIKNGLLVTADKIDAADLLIQGGTIRSIGAASSWQADRIIDAEGRYVLPGGIDAHTHLDYPVAGFTAVTVDDFRSGTEAAAYGGTTTIIDFVKTRPGESVYDTYMRRRDGAASDSIVDFGFHAIVPPASSDREFDELARLVDEGAKSWKFFMSYRGLATDDATILRGLRHCRELGIMPLIHAENDAMLSDARQALTEQGRTGVKEHCAAHPASAEEEATHRAIALAAQVQVPLYVVHVSSAGAAAQIGRARERGSQVFGETCPQYLARCFEEYGDADEATAAGHICSPPIRSKHHQEALWSGLSEGQLSTIATDHACFPLERDHGNENPYKHHKTFLDVPNGVPGIEERLMVVWEAGVASARISLPQFVALTSTTPAKLFGLFPRKGAIQVGSDADLVVWNPNGGGRLSGDLLHSKAGYSLYDGMKVSATPEIVLSHGEVIVEGGRLQAEYGRGEYLVRRETSLGAPIESLSGAVTR